MPESEALPIRLDDLVGRRIHDAQAFDEREEGARERRCLRSRPHLVPVDLFAERARPLEDAAEVRLLLGDRHELRDHDVLERRDVDEHRHHLGERRPLDELVGDRAARGVVDQVDERAVRMPRLHEPTLRRSLGLPARGLERVERDVHILDAYEEVDVVLASRPAARPRRHPAAEDERDFGALEDPDGGPHRVDQLLEGRLRHSRVVSVLPDSATLSA